MRIFRRKCHQKGLSYIGILILVALVGLGSVVLAEVDSLGAQREKEKELLFVGHQFREAIKRYYEAPVLKGGVPQYPNSLEDLLVDTRFGDTRRYLRKIYIDPITGKDEWGMVLVAGKIVGVHSLSEASPIKKNGFEIQDIAFQNSSNYQQWIFSYPHDVILKYDISNKINFTSQ